MHLHLYRFVRHARLAVVPGVLLLAATLLTGCASTRLIDSEVNSFTAASPLPANATFRFERLPSDAGSTEQDTIESLAKPVLSKAGLVLTEDHPAYSVQLQLSTLRLPGDPRNAGYPMQFGVPPGWRAGGFGLFADIPWYHNTLQLVMRDLASDMANLQKIISENCKSAGDSEMFINGGPIKKEIDRLITKYESYECALFKSEDYAAAEQFCKDVGLPLTCIKTHSDGTFYVVVDTVPLQKMSDLFEGTEDYITLTEYDNLRKTLDTQFEVINSSVLTMQNRSSQMYNQFTIFIAAISSSIEQIYSTLAMYLK